MDLPPELPCYNCGRIVDRENKFDRPSNRLPDLPPAYMHPAAAMEGINDVGRIPDGLYLERNAHAAALKQYIKKNWWCKECYEKRMEELG